LDACGARAAISDYSFYILKLSAAWQVLVSVMLSPGMKQIQAKRGTF